MSIPSPDDATQQKPNANAEKQEATLEDQLAIATQRQKDTQASYTKGQQAIKAQEAVIAKLTEQLEGATKVTIPEEDQKRLDQLKYDDPVAWRQELNQLELVAQGESKAKLTELTSTASKAANVAFELERREQVLKEFNESAEIAITNVVLANDVPPRITNKLANNEITFEEMLEEISAYLKTGKVVKNEETLGQPNLGNNVGGDKPGDFKPEESLSQAYKKVLY